MVRSLVREGGQGGIGDCSLLILNPTAYVTKWIHCSAVASSMLTFQLPGHRTKEWILMYEKKKPFFPVTLISSRPHPRFWNPMGVGRPLSIFRITLWSSEGDINLTLRLRAFICLWELRSTAQTTVTILQIPLYTTFYTQNTHTRANTPEQLGLCVPLITVFNTGVFTVLL